MGSNIVRLVGHVKDEHELWRIKKAIDERLKVVQHQDWLAKCAVKKAEAMTWPVGQVLWCCMNGFSVGGAEQRGSRYEVIRAWPASSRAKYPLWLRNAAGRSFTANENWLTRYAIGTVEPDNKCSAEQAAAHARMGAVIAEALR